MLMARVIPTRPPAAFEFLEGGGTGASVWERSRTQRRNYPQSMRRNVIAKRPQNGKFAGGWFERVFSFFYLGRGTAVIMKLIAEADRIDGDGPSRLRRCAAPAQCCW